VSPGLRWIMETLSTLPDAPIEVRAAVRAAVKRAVRGLPWVPGFVARDVGVKRRKPIGRPRGHGSLDAEQAVTIAAAIDVHGLSKVNVLRHLGRLPAEGSSAADYHWLQRRLELGRSIMGPLPRTTRTSNDRAKRQRSPGDSQALLTSLFGPPRTG
jgi:hypothetical protein